MHIFIVDLILISKHTSVVKLIASCISVSPLTSFFFCRQEVDILLIFWSTSFLQFLILHICCKNLVQGLNLFLVRTFDIKSMLVPNRGPDLKRQLCNFFILIALMFCKLKFSKLNSISLCRSVSPYKSDTNHRNNECLYYGRGHRLSGAKQESKLTKQIISKPHSTVFLIHVEGNRTD